MHIPITHFGNLNVLRGDLIKGGAKMPALLRYLPRLNHHHIAYVGSVYGSGAWAVAEACITLGIKSTLFIAKSDYTPVWLPYIKETGANLVWCDPLPVADLHKMVNIKFPEFYNLPLGFDTPEFMEDMSLIIQESVPTELPEIWIPVLSGVLARSARLAFPNARIHAVCVAKNHGDIGKAIPHSAPEKFHKPTKSPPPYPACPFSDAKVWQFAKKMAVSGSFILNVGV